MLEQKEPARKAQPGTDPQQMTQLEGIRQKVFMDRYSLKDPSGQPLEHYPEQTWARVARGIAAVEPTDALREHWEQRFYEALSGFQFVPGGRILAGAGSGHQVTFYNCLSGDTLVHTKQGMVPIGTLQGEHDVLSDSGVYRPAFFKSYGKQQLWKVTLANGTQIYATADHQWVVNKEKGGTERVTTRDLEGRRIPINPRPAPDYDNDFAEGVQHGIVYGDGSVQYGKAHVCLFEEKEQLAGWFDPYRHKESGGSVATKEHIRVQGLPATWKELPTKTASASYWRGFVAGLIATEGHVDERGSVAIYNGDRQALERIVEGMAIAGFVSSGITMTREVSPHSGEEKPVYRLQLFKAAINQRDILHPKHQENFLQSPAARNASIRVESVEETDRYEEVYCCVEPETHTITISHGYLTGQCYVIPSPEDSRQGILDNLKTMTEIMARGGGVGINLSTLRPRGSYIKTVNGTASGPCSWAQLYSVATGDVIQQGGCFGPDERIATDHGLIRAKELADRLEAGEHIQAKTHRGTRPFTYVFRNGIKDLYEVKTHRGYRVQVTLDHKMGVLRHGKLTTIPLRELQKGDEILLLLGEDIADKAPLVPLSASPYQRSKMSTTLNEKVTLPTHLTAELAYLLGFFYGDGLQSKKVAWQDEKGISFTVEHAHPDLQERLVSLVKSLFSLEPAVYPGDGACATIKVYSRLLVGWLQENGLLKQKANAVRVPEAIFCSPSHVMAAFIEGYFDADGCDRGGEGGYGIDSVSREMLEDIQQLLLANGIVSHITTQDRSKQGWLPIHRLLITGAQFRERCSQFIGSHKDQQRLGYRSHNSNYPMEVWDTLGIPGRYYQGLFDATKERVAPSAGVGMLERPGALLNILPDTIVSITPVGSSDVYDFEVDDVHLLSGGGFYTSNSRRGALMLMLDDNHPDIEEFITVKRTEGKIEHANLSVAISDRFMQAVKDDEDWDLVWQGEVKKTIRARYLWDLICKSAWESAEPGVVFMDRYNKLSNTWYYEDIRCVNPCGEQGLPPWGVCNLGALNLSAFVQNGKMDYQHLAEMSKVAMRFLDNVVDANEYFIEENREAQLSTRRTGLGTMGLADALIKMKVAYGSEESIPIIERIYSTIRDAAYEASADIAVEKGSFPKFDRDKYMQGKFIQRLPKAIQDKIKKQGIRNAVLLTQAPTGTTSLLSGVSSGIEPVYDFAMVRRDRTGEHILYHPLLQEWRDKHPDEPTPKYFVSANDLTPEEHVRVQATIQKYTDSSISKTVNAPNSHTVEDVQTLYRLAYELGCKGITYMRDGSRVGVLSHIEEKKPEQQEQQATVMTPVTSIQQGVKPRPPVVRGYTRQVNAPEGKINVTINSDEHGPLEVFVNVGKAGSDIAALAEALGRLISLNLRILSPLSQTDRVKEIADQLRGIGGSRSVGFGPQQVRSLPDAVARALELHVESLEQEAEKHVDPEAISGGMNGVHTSHTNGTQTDTSNSSPLSLSRLNITGNLCPQCGCNTMVYEEGCKKCYNCGHSEC
jgi:ribonucleotide reductase alpha subunit